MWYQHSSQEPGIWVITEFWEISMILLFFSQQTMVREAFPTHPPHAEKTFFLQEDPS